MRTETLTVAEALREAAEAAGYAPSIHNTQPWHWKVRATSLELWSAPERKLDATDPEGRMLTLSCGAALHHARVALTALGFDTSVVRFPDQRHPEHLARIMITGQRPVTGAAMRRYQAIAFRHTDRRPVTDPAGPDALLAVTMAVQAEDCYLHRLTRDQVIELAAAAGYAQRVELAEETLRAELGYWTGGNRPTGTGIPDANIPATAPQTTVPGRDFGHPGTLAITAEHDTAATYAILYGERDDPAGWLRAGEALSAGWLAATGAGVSVLPLSAVIEVVTTRERLRGMLTAWCHPYLVLRLGTADPAHHGPRPTPRLPSAQTVEFIDD